MSHAADGDLHAYLDGALRAIDAAKAEGLAAHLEVCSDCRARLEAARALRERATDILALAGPETVPVPPFTEVLAVAGAGDGDGSPAGDDDVRSGAGGRTASWWRRRGVDLAWAASLALALGLGWLGRGLWSGDAGADRLASAQDARPARVEAEPRARTRPEPSLEPSRLSTPAEPSPGAGAAGETMAQRQAAKEDAGQEDAGQEDAGQEDAVQEEAAQQRVVRERAALDRLEPAADERARLVWIPTSRANARRWLDGPVLTVGDLPLEEIAIGEEKGVRLVRSRQRLDARTILELVQRPATEPEPALKELDAIRLPELGARSEDRRAGAELSHLAVLHAGFLVEATAPVAIDSLRALLSRLH